MAKLKINHTEFKELQDNFYEFSRKASEIFRQLALAGVAIVWLFKMDIGGKMTIPIELVGVVKLFIFALCFDFLHAFIPSLIYGIYHEILRYKGKQDKDAIFFPSYFTIPAWAFYLLKMVFMIIAYYELLVFVYKYLNLK